MIAITIKMAALGCLCIVTVATAGVITTLAQKEMPLTGSKAAVAAFVKARDKNENLEDVGTMFDEVVKMDPNFAFAYLFAGQTNPEFQKNLDTAVAMSKKVSPGEREWILATRDANVGNQTSQLAHWNALAKMYPGDKRVQMQLANYYRNIGNDVSALRYLSVATRIDKNYAPAYNLIGYSNLNLGRFPAAEAAFKQYIKLIPNNPNPYDSYAEFLLNTGKYDESIAQYRMALAKDPTFVNSYRGIGNDYAYKGDYDKARDAYHDMYGHSTNDFNRDTALFSEMDSYIQEGNIAKALEVNDRRIAAFEKAGDIATAINLHNQAEFILVETGDLDGADARSKMGSQLSNDPSLLADLAGNRSFAHDLQRSRYYAAKGDWAKAAHEVDQMGKFAATAHNDFVTRNYNQAAGWVELKQKHYAKALAFFAKGNQQDPYLWFYQAEAYEGSGNTKAAMALYAKIANWNQLDQTGYSLVRARAMAKVKK